MSLLYKLSLSPERSLSEEALKSIMGSPSKATWHRQLNELLQDTIEVPALLLESRNTEGNRVYCLNIHGWSSFLDAHHEGKFLLECYKQVGHLLESNFAEMVFDVDNSEKKDLERLERKFLHLVKVGAAKTLSTRRTLDIIIQGLISERQIELTYDGGVRTIMPLTLCQHRDELYIMCYRLKDQSQWEERTYKLARISGIKLLEKKFPYPSRRDWDPVRDYQKSSGIVLGNSKKVTVRFYGLSRRSISEKSFFNGQLINRDLEFDTYLCEYTNPSEFLGQLFVYAQDVEIVDDLELQEEFVLKAKKGILRNTKSIAS